MDCLRQVHFVHQEGVSGDRVDMVEPKMAGYVLGSGSFLGVLVQHQA